MPTPPTDDTRTLFKLLADGEWHDYEEIRDALAATVPPGRALRKYEERVSYARKYKGDPTYNTQLSEDERIYFGARACAQIQITAWKGRGVDYRTVGERKQIRKRPGFRTFGVDVPETPTDPPAEVSKPSEAPPVPQEGPSDVKLNLCQVDETGGQPDPEPEQKAEEPVRCDCIEPEPAQPVVEVGEVAAESGRALLAAARDEALRDVPVEGPAESLAVAAAEGPVYDACPQCGLFVSDKQLHEDFHTTHPAASERSDMALFSESEVRHLLTTVVSEQLDRFQDGMEEWLGERFAQVDSQFRDVLNRRYTARIEPVQSPY